MNESEFAQSLMDWYDTLDWIHSIQWDVEVHYNYYGSRGVVDLVAETERDEGTALEIFELKSESALDNVTGANEIIRQFKKHKNYFFKGNDDYDLRLYGGRPFILLFTATPRNVAHLRKNARLYQDVIERQKGTSSIVAVWDDEIGIVEVLVDEVWNNDERAYELRELMVEHPDYKPSKSEVAIND